MTSATNTPTLGEISLAIVDCEHKTAPEDRAGTAWVVGTPALVGGTIDFAQARRVSESTYAGWTRRMAPAFGDIILAREAPVGPAALVPPGIQVALGQRTVLIRPDPDLVEHRYLHAVLTSPRMQAAMKARAEGSTVPHLNVAEVRNLVLQPLLPLIEQRAIADVLGALDDKIEANRRLGQWVDQFASATFARTVAGMPEHPLAESLDVVMGAPFAGQAFQPAGIGRPLLRIRDLKTFEPQTWTTEVRRDEVLIQPGDVVVGMDAEFRSTLWLGPTALLNQRVCTFRPRLGVGTAFALYAVRDELARAEFSKTGTTVIHLNKADIDRFRIPALTDEQQAALADETEALIRRWVAAAGESRTLAALRDALLPELLSGRMRVPEAREQVEAVV